MKSIFILGMMIILMIHFVLLVLYHSWADANMVPFESEVYSGFLFYIFPLIIWLFLPSDRIQNNNLKRNKKSNNTVSQTDINNANINELRALPFINTALAKRIIKKREEIGGFKTIDDVCLYLKFNVEKSIKFREYICVNPIVISPADIKLDERSVDW